MTTPTTSVDWETLCVIYGDGEDDECDFDETTRCRDGNDENSDERKVKLEVSAFPRGGFCGTVYMSLSSSKIAFARLVRSDGSYRYFTIAKPPILKLDLLYFTTSTSTITWKDAASENDIDEGNDWSQSSESDGPSNLRLAWEYYPTEWPVADEEKYRSSLAKKCHAILREEGSFSVCQFLEHDAISFYHGNHATDATIAANEENDDNDGDTPVTNASNSWKTYPDENYPDYLLVVLPPKMDQLYYPTIGSLLHPRKEAALLEEAAAKEKTDAANANAAAVKSKAGPNKTIASKKKTKKTKQKRLTAPINNTLDFGRHALLQNWKDLYMTRCPICLEESILYSDGVVFPYCQHYCCRDCFDTYLSFKVQDLKEHRTNPFLCPVESCKLELPMVFCKPYLSDEDIKAAKAWYKDLKNPPAWSLDRCPHTKTCGAVGSMRRLKGVVSIDAASGKTHRQNSSTPDSSSSSSHLVYCESCKKKWCELCLTRVYDDDCCTIINPGNGATKQKKNTISNHKRFCNPRPMLKFCRRYTDASEEIKATAEAKYPWIVSYSQFCQHDGAALQYVLDHGQRCPTCQTGVERIEGCFHVKCPTCATHFCYECGTELFPPYYGTHHCWEENGNGNANDEEEDEEDIYFWNNHANYDVDEQLAAAIQWMGNDF